MIEDVGEDSHQEGAEPKISFEEAKEILKAAPFPVYAPKFFGEENMKRLEEILNDERVVEAGSLSLCGDISNDELFAYITLLPEYHEIRERLMNVAAAIVEELRPKLKRDYMPRGVKNMKKGVLKVFMSIQELVFSQKNKEYRGFMWARMQEFEATLFVYLTYVLLCELGDRPEYIESVDRDINYLNTLFIEKGKGVFPGKAFARFFDRLTKVTKGEHINSWKSFCCATPVEEEADLREENMILKEDIINMGELRTVSPFLIERGGVRVFFEGNESEWAETKMSAISTMAIVLDPKIIYQPVQGRKSEQGGHLITFPHQEPSVVYIDFDRATGEFVFPETNFPVKGFFGSHEYAIIENIILNALRGHLETKEDTIVFPDSEAIASTIAEIQEEMQEEIEGGTGQSFAGREEVREFEPTWTYVPYGNNGGTQEEEPLSPLRVEIGAVPRTEPRTRLRSLKTSMVLKALERILGKPIRQNGSHVIFTGKNGGNYPIATGHAEMGPRLLCKCLGQYGICNREFMENV